MRTITQCAVLVFGLSGWLGLAVAEDSQSPPPEPGVSGIRVAQAGVARVVTVSGAVDAVDPEGNRRVLPRGSRVFQGDTVITAQSAQAQLRFSNGALVALRPESVFRIDAYHHVSGPGGEQRAPPP